MTTQLNQTIEDLNLTNSTNETGDENNDHGILVEISHVYLGFVIPIGLGGNILCIIMFASKNLRKKSPSQYLGALAVVDMIFLLTVLCAWLKRYGIQLMYNGPTCKLVFYASHVSSALSSWLICTFTFERFIIVFYPLYRTSLCTVRRARIIVACLVASALILNSWVLLGTEAKEGVCRKGTKYLQNLTGFANEAFLAFTALDNLFTLALPFTMIAALNAAIAWQIKKSSKLRARLSLDLFHVGLQSNKFINSLNSASTTSRESNVKFEMNYLRKASLDPLLSYGTIKRIARAGIHKRKQSIIKKYNERRITVVLVTISMCYLILNLPGHVVRLLNAIFNATGDSTDSIGFNIVFTISTMLFYTQFGINFFLYSVQGRLHRNVPWFRTAVSKCMQCSRKCCRRTSRLSHHSRKRSLLSDKLMPNLSTIREREPPLMPIENSAHVQRDIIHHPRTAKSVKQAQVKGSTVNRKLYAVEEGESGTSIPNAPMNPSTTSVSRSLK